MTPDIFAPEFIYELDDGRLMVTDELFRKIYIFEWVNNPPCCDLFIVTPMPYIGPSPALIEFDASGSSDPDPCDELSFSWDFDGDLVFDEPVDDSYTGTPDHPTHSYTQNYTGPVNLKVTDLNEEESLCTEIVSVIIL